MARKRWTIDLEDGTHTVEIDEGYWTGRRTIRADGVPVATKQRLPRFPSYDILFDVSGHPCAIRTSIRGISYSHDLIVDGRSATTGALVKLAGPTPKWSLLFIAACGALIGIGGMIGALIGILGVAGCARIARDREMGAVMRPVLCGMVTALAWGSYAIVSVVLLGGVSLLGHSAATSFTPMPLDSLHGSGQVYFVPLGQFPVATLNELTSYYRVKYGLEVTVLPPVTVHSNARNSRRHQLIAEQAISLMQASYPDLARDPSAVLIGLTTDDMYIQQYDWSFAFNYREDGRFAVVATSRMRLGVSFANEALWEARVRKMVTKNIGVLYYHLSLSGNPHSVLYNNVGGLQELDAMGEDF